VAEGLGGPGVAVTGGRVGVRVGDGVGMGVGVWVEVSDEGSVGVICCAGLGGGVRVGSTAAGGWMTVAVCVGVDDGVGSAGAG